LPCCLIAFFLLSPLDNLKNNVIIIDNDNDTNYDYVLKINNMASQKLDLIFHPVRLRLLQVLFNARLTTQEIADLLPSTPKSSIYRHLKLLLDEKLVLVVDTRPVKGILEKVYTLEQTPHLTHDDLQNLTKEDHMRFFTLYVASLLGGFSDYLETTTPQQMPQERFGYNDVSVFANEAEFTEFSVTLNELLNRLKKNPSSPDRSHQLISLINFPLK